MITQYRVAYKPEPHLNPRGEYDMLECTIGEEVMTWALLSSGNLLKPKHYLSKKTTEMALKAVFFDHAKQFDWTSFDAVSFATLTTK